GGLPAPPRSFPPTPLNGPQGHRDATAVPQAVGYRSPLPSSARAREGLQRPPLPHRRGGVPRPPEGAGAGRAALIGRGGPDAGAAIRDHKRPAAPDVLRRESSGFPASTVLGRNPALVPQPRPAAHSQPSVTSSPRPRTAPRPPPPLQRRVATAAAASP
ncbi:WAS/WASL-interacting protein family member 1-like, partial [Hylobates moloch]|uniref:WAS/WASL-interacting protein family member 1-like n=1 Tax=Hylobates moloch TaxID=81572 RepID=UPI002675C9FB